MSETTPVYDCGRERRKYAQPEEPQLETEAPAQAEPEQAPATEPSGQE